MAQINKGDTFVDGQSVTGARLNALVDSATLAAGAITEQTNITANTVASGDSILLYDLSATALREANVSDVLGSNLPVTTSAITAGANSDIVITPNDATVVSGIPYVSADGLTVVATTPTAHGLTVGQVLLISAAGTGYNGTFRITAVQTFSPYTFTYVMTTAATAGSGSLSYTNKGTVKNIGNKTISGNLYVDGNAVVTGTTIQTGAVTQTGTVNITGAASLTTAPTTGNHITNKTYVDGTVSKIENGYCRLPNGLILQWATGVGGTTETSQTITFPIAFPNACLNVQVSCWSYYADIGANTWFQEIEKTTTYVVVRYQASAGSTLFYCTPRIFAIGH